MATPKRNPKPIISGNIGDAASSIVLDALDAGFDIEEIAPSKGPKLKGQHTFQQEALDEVVSLANKGAPIPGQSLMNSPDEPRNWETPPKFANPREALDEIDSLILEPEAIENVVLSLARGATVADLGIAILYAKYTEGVITPDVLMMLVEPLMYVIMSIGEEANIKYNIDGNDADEFEDEDDDENEKQVEVLNEYKNPLQNIKNKINVEDVNEAIVPKNILDKVKEKSPEIKSILSRGET